MTLASFFRVFSFFVLLIPLCVKGQMTIKGQILEQNTQRPIADVIVYNAHNFSATISGVDGSFSTIVESLPVVLFFQHIGYQEDSLLINKVEELQVFLHSRQLQEVVVSSASAFQDGRTGRISINKSVVDALPSLGAEVDYISSLVVFPGVSNGEEISKGITVRGGSIDQNLTHINGVQTSNTGHLFNLYSVVPAVGVEDLTFYKGGMPAHFGNALSSSMDVQLRKPTKKLLIFELGATNSKASFENTFGRRKKSSLLISGRSSYIDFFRTKANKATLNDFKPRGADAAGPEYHFGYTFFDVLATANINLGENYTLSAFGLYSYDRNTYIYNRAYITYLRHELRNATYGINFSKKWSAASRLELKAGLNNHNIERFERNLDFDVNNTLVNDEFLHHIYGLKNWTAKVDFYHKKNKTQLNTGLFSYYKQYQPGDGELETFVYDPVLRTRDTIALSNKNNEFGILLSGVYLQVDTKVKEKISLNTGLRASIFFGSPKTHTALEPRFALTCKTSKKTDIHASFDYLTQFDHGLVLSEVGLDNLISLPSIEDIKPARSLNYALGIVSKRLDHKLILSLEMFYKRQWNLQRLALGQKNKIISNSLSELIAKNGTANAYGFETQITYQTQGLLINSSYTYSHSFRYFKNFNNDKTFPFAYDKPHEWSLSGVKGLGAKLSFSFNFNLSNGARYTLPSGFNPSFVAGGRPILIYDGHQNETHLPLYHRLDIGLDYKFNTHQKWKGILKLNIINVYNRRNINFVELRENTTGNYDIEGVSYIPVLPSLSLKLSR